jgi:hypothetical protein
MEARGESQSRTKVNPRKAGLSGRACFPTQRPISNRGRTVVGAATARSHSSLPQEISSGPATVEPEEATTKVSMPEEKSDRLIVATKPVKASRAKGAMGFEA